MEIEANVKQQDQAWMCGFPVRSGLGEFSRFHRLASLLTGGSG
ncbi:MAG: hypothetical protein ACPGXX_10265 [Planctomycetaceae bacterium]